jgi:hypothetical protein
MKAINDKVWSDSEKLMALLGARGARGSELPQAELAEA